VPRDRKVIDWLAVIERYLASLIQVVGLRDLDLRWVKSTVVVDEGATA
jgi:hypothetical protein